jgi:nucleoside-diphosphate-sugar epimerase
MAGDGMRGRRPLALKDLAEVTARTQAVFRELAGSNILITGAGGFVGSWLTETLLHGLDQVGLASSVTITTRSEAAYRALNPTITSHPRIRIIQADIADPQALAGLSGITHVIHAASMVNGQRSPAGGIAVLDSIQLGTSNLLRWAKHNPLRRFLFISSGAVYGRPDVGTSGIPETMATVPHGLGPETAYGIGKRSAELMACLHASMSGYEMVIARLWSFVGPRLPLDGHFAIGNFVADVLAGRRIKVTGDGTSIRSYQYVGDLCVWLWTLLVRGNHGEAYNVGSSEPVAIADLANVVNSTLNGSGVDIRADRSPVNGDCYVPDTRKACSSFGLNCDIALPEGIRRMAAYGQQTSL